MTDNDISQRISQLRAEIAAAEGRIAEAEKNIRQLNALQKSCNDYHTKVGDSKSKRKTKREDFIGILNQDHLVDAYGYVLDDILRVGGADKNLDYHRALKGVFYVFQRTKIYRIRSISPNKFRF